jgi:hypothetical protein
MGIDHLEASLPEINGQKRLQAMDEIALLLWEARPAEGNQRCAQGRNCSRRRRQPTSVRQGGDGTHQFAGQPGKHPDDSA